MTVQLKFRFRKKFKKILQLVNKFMINILVLMDLLSAAMFLWFSRRPAQTPCSAQPITTCIPNSKMVYIYSSMIFLIPYPPNETDVVFFLLEITTGNAPVNRIPISPLALPDQSRMKREYKIRERLLTSILICICSMNLCMTCWKSFSLLLFRIVITAFS